MWQAASDRKKRLNPDRLPRVSCNRRNNPTKVIGHLWRCAQPARFCVLPEAPNSPWTTERIAECRSSAARTDRPNSPTSRLARPLAPRLQERLITGGCFAGGIVRRMSASDRASEIVTEDAKGGLHLRRASSPRRTSTRGGTLRDSLPGVCGATHKGKTFDTMFLFLIIDHHPPSAFNIHWQ